MKILMVGATSAIGLGIAASLRSHGEVRLAGRRGADFQFELSQWERQPEINEAFDVVIHVAADFGGDTNDDFVRAEVVNAAGTLSVCRLAQHVQAKHFVLMSSIFAAYGQGDPYFGIYALSKRHSEEVAGFFCAERGLPLTVLRPSQVYDAAGECRRHQALLYIMADRAEAGQDINLYGMHDASRNYIYLDDLAEVCCRVVEGTHTGTFALSHPKSVKLSEMANAAFDAFGKGGGLYFMADKPDQADLPTIDDDTLYRQIDYWPKVDIGEGFRRINDFREANSCPR
jgi:nucleoside-diphosphate-sugar epimerase